MGFSCQLEIQYPCLRRRAAKDAEQRILEVDKEAFQGEVVCARGAALIPPEHRRFHAGDVKNPAAQ